MTLPSTPFRKDHTGNGTTGPFLYDWKILSNTHLKVIKQVIATGIETELVLGVDYSVTGVGNDGGGNVNLTNVLPGTEKITILPNVPYEQDTDFTNQNSVKPEEAEEMADKLGRQIKQVVEKLSRAVILPESSTDSPVNYITTMNEILADTVTAKNAAETARDDILNNAGFIVVAADLLGSDTIGTVAADITNVNTAAGSIANINTVAGAIGNVNIVAGDISNVNTVATNISAVNDASTNMAAIIAAPTEAANAAASASQAETFKNQAQAYADSMAFRDVVFITNADSPYTVTQANHNGKMISVDTSGGAVTVNLPQISGLTLPFVFAVKKATGDNNAVTINRAGTDTINDGVTTSKVLSNVSGSQFLPDTDTSPDRWTTVDFGASAADEKRQVFTAPTHFTPGITTTLTLTNAPIAGTSAGLDIAFDGVQQLSTEWAYNPTTGVITFNEAIPLSTEDVECRWRTSLPVGVPSDGSISWLKLASGLIASVAEMVSGTANKLISAANLKTFLDTYSLIRTQGPVAASGTATPISENIPSWAKRVTVHMNGISSNGAAAHLIQVGNGSYVTTGYVSGSVTHQATNASVTNGILINSGASTNNIYGSLVLSRVVGDTWLWSSAIGNIVGATAGSFITCGVVSLSGALDRIRYTTNNGTDVMDAGQFFITWE